MKYLYVTNIKKYREKRHMSIFELSDITGIEDRVLYAMERDAFAYSAYNLKAVSAALLVPMDHLITLKIVKEDNKK